MKRFTDFFLIFLAEKCGELWQWKSNINDMPFLPALGNDDLRLKKAFLETDLSITKQPFGLLQEVIAWME